MHSLTKKLLILCVITFLASCNNQKFNRKTWDKSDGGYNLRDPMVNDLIKNHLDIGMKYSNVIELLGKPNGKMDKNYKIYYEVYYDTYKGLNKCLTVQFTKDSLVKSFEKVEWID